MLPIALLSLLLAADKAPPLQLQKMLEQLDAPADAKDGQIEIVGEITEGLSTIIEGKLKDCDKAATIRINTEGGDFDEALKVSQIIEEHSKRIPIECVVDGLAASSGFFILQSCPVRIVTERSALMAHEPYFPSVNHADRTRLQSLSGWVVAMARQYAVQGAARMKIGLKEFQRRIEGQDWWLDPSEALDLGACDRVIPSPNKGVKKPTPAHH